MGVRGGGGASERGARAVARVETKNQRHAEHSPISIDAGRLAAHEERRVAAAVPNADPKAAAGQVLVNKGARHPYPYYIGVGRGIERQGDVGLRHEDASRGS